MRMSKFVTMFVLLVSVLVGLSGFAFAQEVPQFEVSGGLAAVPAVHTTPSPGDNGLVFPEGHRAGIYGSLHVPFNDVVGLEVEATHTAGHAVAFPDQRIDSNEVFAGLRFSDREVSKHVILYFNTLIGKIQRPVLLSYTGRRVSFEGGAGMNWYFTQHVGLNFAAAYSSPFMNRQFEQFTVRVGVALK